jgi:hypothetical protein
MHDLSASRPVPDLQRPFAEGIHPPVPPSRLEPYQVTPSDLTAKVMRDKSSVIPIEVRVERLSQLFDTLDPFPFRERDLDKDAEQYIVGWAQEFPRHQPLDIVIHVPECELKNEYANELSYAFSRYFNYRAEIVGRDLNELFRIGRLSLLIGLTVLAVCVLVSRTATAVLGSGNISRFAEESLIILGWVANWKPIEIFLYDWWPLARRRDLYRRLAAATVELRPVRPSRTAEMP